MIERAMLCGSVAELVATCGARLTAALVEVRAAHELQIWAVFSGAPAVEEEFAKVAEGDLIACLGWAKCVIGPKDGPSRIMSADGVLALRQRRVPVAPSRQASLRAEAMPAIERLTVTAHAAGVAAERTRIGAIMNGAGARTNPALAWRLAETGVVTREAAEAALAISALATIATAGEGDSARFH